MTVGLLTITEAAASRVKTLLESRGKPSYGIRIGLRSKGCSGLSYTLEFADEAGPYDEVIEAHDVKVLIDPKAVMFIMGSQMDYVEDQAFFWLCVSKSE